MDPDFVSSGTATSSNTEENHSDSKEEYEGSVTATTTEGMPRSVTGMSGITNHTRASSQNSSRHWKNPYNRAVGRWNLWSNIAEDEQNWENLDEEESVDGEGGGEENNEDDDLFNPTPKLRAFWYELKHIVVAFVTSPMALLVTLAVFAGLLFLGIHLVNLLAERVRQQMEYEATCTAMESANTFAELFRKALLPLFSLQQAVTHSPYFMDLPRQMKSAGAVSGAKSPSPNVTDYRNITGICDNEELQAKFKEIVDSIQKSQEMDGVIITYRLAPHAVFCMAEPMEAPIYPYSEEKFFKNQGSMGWDPLASGSDKWHYIVRNTLVYNNDSVDILGPLSMKGLGFDGKEMYCGHKSVTMPGKQSIEIDGVTYDSWGFVMHFINWDVLKDRAEVYRTYNEQGLDFHLTRTDTLFNSTSGENYDVPITIATSKYGAFLTDENSVVRTVQTVNGEWTNRVGYIDGYEPDWYDAAVVGVAVLAAIMAIMLGIILVERKLHKMLLFKIMPRKAIKKLHRGQTVIERYNMVTIFFSDIVGFTNMAGTMRPVQVMKMLNALYKEFDRIAAKHDVYKVETIGDAYMVVGGCPDRCNGVRGAEKVALFAIDIIKMVKEEFRTENGSSIQIRCGLASGPVVAGVVGNAMPRYCLFGDTVNLASRMESTSKTMKIQCNEVCYRLLRDAPNYAFALHERMNEQSGNIKGTASQISSGVMIKGKGMMQTWWIQRAISLDGGKYTNPGAIVKSVREPPPRAITFNIPNDAAGGESSSTDGLLLLPDGGDDAPVVDTIAYENNSNNNNNEGDETTKRRKPSSSSSSMKKKKDQRTRPATTTKEQRRPAPKEETLEVDEFGYNC